MDSKLKSMCMQYAWSKVIRQIGWLLLGWLAVMTLCAFGAWDYTICQHEQGYDMACLREQYAKPVGKWPQPVIDKGVVWQELAPVPNRLSSSLSAKAKLGERLFFETALSLDGQISCGSCHRPEYAFADPRTVSVGVLGRKGERNSQSLVHLGLMTNQVQFFWDGRAKSLSEQVLLPLTNPNEMAISLDSIDWRLQEVGYLPKFRQVFGQQVQAITIEQFSQAVVAYLQSLTPAQTSFDTVLLGDVSAFDDQQLLGLHLFRTKARCMNCHFGQAMSDGKLHNLNQTLAGSAFADFGAYAITGNSADFGKFKTPSLRNLAQSKPWFHHGRFTNLEGVVEMYNQAMPERLPKSAPPLARQNHKDALIVPLGLTRQERKAVVAFLLTL
ncbi:cytochrome c peroxidase [Moraxella cuniculi DSM 21768]|uniref:Cytochrome c peroxidase n=2 Tax=Moraxella cuniculi TaxID=34061 RepID=A0A1N7DQR2_9GAMM|nr:cytochrome c peroxidase [Moraxella cuniculi DSM 21768]